MVLRVSTAKIVSRPIDPVEEVVPETTFIAIDTYIQTSQKDEFIFGNLFDYNGNKINYIWDSKKNQVASLKGKNLNTEMIISASEFLKSLYKRPNQELDVNQLAYNIVNSIKEIAEPIAPRKYDVPVTAINAVSAEIDNEVNDNNFVYDYENDESTPIFAGEFLSEDEEPDDFDEQLAKKSQEFLKEHPELKTEMEIVRLLEGN